MAPMAPGGSPLSHLPNRSPNSPGRPGAPAGAVRVPVLKQRRCPGWGWGAGHPSGSVGLRGTWRVLGDESPPGARELPAEGTLWDSDGDPAGSFQADALGHTHPTPSRCSVGGPGWLDTDLRT